MELFLFKDILIIFGLSIVVLLIGSYLKVPPVVGFLITGLLAGPHGFGLVAHLEDVEMLAQIGILLLLFGIGMEFSIKRLIQMKRLFFWGGALQVGLSVAVCYLAAITAGRTSGEALFLGFLISLSSTAVVLRLLDEKGEAGSPHGRLSLAILIFQDLVAIPMILMTPFLGQSADTGQEWFLIANLLKGIAILVVVFFCAERVVPRLLFFVAKTKNKELFLVSVFSLCFGVAWLTSHLGLSLTIGAFLAGLIISESEYSNEAVGHVFPFQALFISFFFVSIGMLLDLEFFFRQPFKVLSMAAIILGVKAFIGGATALLLGFPIRTAVLTGIAISQIGEFSFVLAKTGIPYGLASGDEYQLFLAVSLITLAISPVFINLAPQIANLFTSLPFPEKFRTGMNQTEDTTASLKEHILIIGFGISGRNLARSSKWAGIPYLILEMNPETVKEEKRKGEPIYFGDASHPSVLEHVQIKNARAVAILVNDPLAARRIVKNARDANPHVYIIIRTRYLQEMQMMQQLGADEVIPDEFGTSIEIFSRVLRQYHIPDEDIHHLINEIRGDGYELLRRNPKAFGNLSEIKLDLSGVEIGSFRLHPHSPLVGKKLADSQLRQEHGMTVLLIRRKGVILSNPPPDTELFSDDVVVVMGEKMTQKSGEIFAQSNTEILLPAIG